MPGTVLPTAPHWVPAPCTKANCECTDVSLPVIRVYRPFTVQYADLPIIDFSELRNPDGVVKLAQQVHDAMTKSGFFYVINHGHTQDDVRCLPTLGLPLWRSLTRMYAAQTDRMFDIADIPFSQVSEAEKKAYEGRVKETGTYQGYKLRQYWVCH